MIIAGIIGSLAGGGAPKSAALTSTFFEPLNEGQQQTIGVNFYNWDNSPAYWTVADSSGNPMAGQVNQDSGVLYPGPGNTYYSFNFNFVSDATTEGPVSYYIRLGSTVHGSEYFNEGPKICRDSSQTPALVLSVDPASLGTIYGLTGWTDASGQGNNISVVGGTKSANNGGTLVFNGSTTYAGDLMNANLTSSVYGTISLSAWIKPTVVGSGINQTIIAKELCYKLRIDTSGEVQMYTGPGYTDQSWTALTTSAGLVTAGAWAHVVATVNADYKRIYVNGVKVAETTGVVIGANTNQFDIGSYDSINDLFAGSMGEIKVWNYAITESTVLAQYNSTASRYGRSPIPLSLDFPGTGNPYLLVSNTQSDWNLGTTYTIEFWSKGGNASNGAIRTVMTQTDGSGNIDLGYAYANLMFNGTQPNYTEPSPGVWTHVAFVRAAGSGNITLYYNGVYATSFSAGPALSNSGSDLYIGKRGSSVNGQGFYGKLAMLRISTTAKYTENFDPSNSYGVESDTRLMLGRNPLTDLTLYELNGVATVTSDGARIYISKATYPDLNNQIRTGDTVVKVSDSTTSTVTGAVFTPNGDPDNWAVPVSPGWGSVGTVNFSGPGRHPVSVQGAVTTSMDFPNFQSLVFNQPEGDYLSTPGSSDWNLGTTYTIEFWIKANNASGANIHIPGGQWGLINQTGWYGGMQNNSMLIGLSANKLTIAQDSNNAIEFAEPTAGVWTHVAFVNNGGDSAQKVYYNGVEQTKVSGSYQSNGWTNSTDDLYIGRLAPNYVSHFDGKLAMVRISNTAKYLAPFTATTTYGVEADTKLFLGKLNPVVDNKSHTMNINGVTTSTDFPS